VNGGALRRKEVEQAMLTPRRRDGSLAWSGSASGWRVRRSGLRHPLTKVLACGPPEFQDWLEKRKRRTFLLAGPFEDHAPRFTMK
jgi:hypothetical protein